jgi:hypothetical protein
VIDHELPSSYYLLRFARATTLVAAQVRCSIDDATDLMIERCDADGGSLGDLAVDVIEGRIRFDV